MTNIKRRKYSKEFKEEAVALVSTQGYSIAEAARNLGIRGNILSRWRRERQTQQQGAFPGTGHQSPELEELKHLREEGSIHRTPNGHQQPSPWDTIARQHSALMYKYLTEFGLTPATRSKVTPVGNAGKEKDDFERDFGTGFC